MAMDSWTHRARVLVWGEKADSALERRLVQKLDTVILTWACLAFFVNYIDRAGLANAYVSGMQAELGLNGTNLNIINTCLTIGYIIGQVPHALIIQKISPRWWFPAMVIIWGGLTMCCAATHNFGQLCAVRFFQGLIEASTYSGVQYVIGSWYRPHEIGKRTGLFAASGMAGTMFAGLMMTAMYKTLNGHHGLPGWKWLFIILGIITIPIGIAGFFVFPGTPDNHRPWWMTEEERDFAVARLPPKPAGAVKHKLGLDLFKRVLLRPDFWVLTLFWVIGGALEAFCNQSCMLLWMTATKRYSVPDRNDFPLGVTAIGIVATLATAVVIDASHRILPWGLLACGLQLVACIILIIPRLSDHAVFAGFYIAGTSYMIQPVVYTWANKILLLSGDEAVRAITLYAMNGASSVLFAFWGIVLYPATDAPKRYHKGTIAMFVVCAVLAVWCGVVLGLERWVLRKTGLEGEEDGDGDGEVGGKPKGERERVDEYLEEKQDRQEGIIAAPQTATIGP